MFVPALLAILPGHVRWMGAIPIEGLAGRIVGDVLIRYLNVAGAYIVCTTVLAVALYLTTAFSFSAFELWAPTRFAFVLALRDRFQDWQHERERKRQQKELEKRRAEKPTVTAQLVPARPMPPRQEFPRQDAPRNPQDSEIAQEIPGVQSAALAPRTGIERMMAEENDRRRPHPAAPESARRNRSRSHRPSRRRAPAKDDPPQNRGQLQAPAVEPAAPSRRAAIHRRRRTQNRRPGSDREVRGVRRPRPSHADQPRPGRHHLRIQARSRHQVQPHRRPHRRSLPRAARRKHPGRAHARQEHGRHPGAEPRARNHLAAREHRVAGIPRLQIQAHDRPWARTSTDA